MSVYVPSFSVYYRWLHCLTASTVSAAASTLDAHPTIGAITIRDTARRPWTSDNESVLIPERLRSKVSLNEWGTHESETILYTQMEYRITALDNQYDSTECKSETSVVFLIFTL